MFTGGAARNRNDEIRPPTRYDEAENNFGSDVAVISRDDHVLARCANQVMDVLVPTTPLIPHCDAKT